MSILNRVTLRKDWPLEEGLTLVQELSGPLLEKGWAIGLTGSVLLKCHSDKDLDIMVYPMSTTGTHTAEDVHVVLIKAGLKLVRTSEEVQAYWREKGSLDEKHVEAWGFRGRRVDVFYFTGR